MSKYKYNINNLDCANCAREIEEELNKDKRLNNVSVNFNTCKISYESEEDISLKELNKLVRKVEPEVVVTLDEVNEKKEYHLFVLILGFIIGILAYVLPISNILKTILFIFSYVLLLYRTTINAVKLLLKSRLVNENLLITISCIGAFLIGERLEGMMVIVLYTIGKLLEEKAVNNSRNSIKNLIDIKEDYANIKCNGKVKIVRVEEVKLGDILLVKKGERVPTDGVIVKGSSVIDTSVITGESELLKAKVNDSVLSGSINMGNIIEIKATSLFENSTVSKMLELIEDATDKKTKTETIVSKISKIYTPIIIILAILVTVLLPCITTVTYKESLYRGLTFLVISCPCAIAISVPLSYFIGIGVASKKGILIKGSNYLDNLSNSKNIIFDKTGTLTNGSFVVNDIEIFDNKYTKDEIIDILVKGESFSNHPIAKSILKLKNGVIDKKIIDYEEVEGKGISYTLDGNKIMIGNKLVCNCDKETTLHLNINGKHVASISISDGIKENAKEAIEMLKDYGLKVYMFTGDKKEVANYIGKSLNIDEIKYEMLPTDKYDNYEYVSNKNGVTIFVGDGVNDAPVLKRADIGISMGGVGVESAIEASDIVIMKDDLMKIVTSIDISSYTKKIIKQNLVFSLSIKLLILILSLFGYANMFLAVFADTGVTLLTILNTLRIVRKFK